ncbi:hypothetical protein Golob_025026, partial [Gossypium lobatum]|nr:hypothetical protein [Gossypium lobatum]
RVTPIPAILAETFRSLSLCQRAGEGRFIGCAQLFLAWFYSHFWKVEKVSYQFFSENYSPLKELVAIARRDDISEEKWIMILQNLQEEDVEWLAPWMIPNEILYQCGDFDWVPLLGIWGAVGYAPLLGNNYKKKVREILNAWNQTCRIKILAVGLMTTPEYSRQWSKRINNNILRPREDDVLSIEEHLQMHLGLDVDIHKLEVEKLRKWKNKAEEDLDSLKTDYKKLPLLIRTTGLGKTSDQWRQEITKEKTRADQWEKKFQDARARENALERSLFECQNEKVGLKARVAELGKSLHLYRSRNSTIKLRASLNKIE